MTGNRGSTPRHGAIFNQQEEGGKKMKLENVEMKDLIAVSDLAKLKDVSSVAVYLAIQRGRLDYAMFGKMKLVVKNEKIEKFGIRKIQ